MNSKINLLKEEIKKNTVFKSKELFGGAGLIITNEVNRTGKDHDVIVFSHYPEELSWLVFKLKELYADKIDYMNKYYFYPRIGELANEAIVKQFNLKDQMLYIIDNISNFDE